MRTKLRKVQEGFTIVEVLIVLAIAALILTIILIAVPDLQRSSRNSNILHDAQNVSSAIQSFEGNNQGSLPDTVALAGSTVTVSSSGGGATSTAQVQKADTVSGTTSLTAVSGTVGTILVVYKASCGGTSGASLTPTANPRGVAVYYPIETSGGANVACIQV